MATVLDTDRIVAGLRGAFARDAGARGCSQYAADKIQAAGPPVHLGLPLHAARRGAGARGLRAAGRPSTPGSRWATASAAPRWPPARTRMSATCARSRITSPATLFTRSELVVLIRRGHDVLGQIDVDSDVARSLHRRRGSGGAAGGRRAGGAAVTATCRCRHSPGARRRALRAPDRRAARRSSCCTAAPARTTTISCPGSTALADGPHPDLLRPARRRAFAGGPRRAGGLAGAGRRPRGAARTLGPGAARPCRLFLGRAARDALRHRAPGAGRALALVSPAPGARRERATYSSERFAGPQPDARSCRRRAPRSARAASASADPAAYKRRALRVRGGGLLPRPGARARPDARSGSPAAPRRKSGTQPGRLRSRARRSARSTSPRSWSMATTTRFRRVRRGPPRRLQAPIRPCCPTAATCRTSRRRRSSSPRSTPSCPRMTPAHAVRPGLRRRWPRTLPGDPRFAGADGARPGRPRRFMLDAQAAGAAARAGARGGCWATRSTSIVALLHHAYLFWARRQHGPTALDPAATRAALLAASRPPGRTGAGAARYIQFPERLVWAEPERRAAARAAGWLFVHRSGAAASRCLASSDSTRAGTGFSVVAAEGARADGRWRARTARPSSPP